MTASYDKKNHRKNRLNRRKVMKLTNDTFDFIRFLAETGITAIGAFYATLAGIWSLPYGKAVMASCLALSTLVGAFVEWQRQKHKKTTFFEGMSDDKDSTGIEQ